VNGVTVFVESTVLGEGQYFTNVRYTMQATRQTVWAGPGPGPQHAARRVLGKIAEELSQTAANAPNILCMSFFGWTPLPPSRQWAVEDAWTGGVTYGTRQDGTHMDLSNISRIDSIFEFGRDRLLHMHVNPHPDPACAL